jgi:aminoglycoside/choline kinase family phosphotransferase
MGQWCRLIGGFRMTVVPSIDELDVTWLSRHLGLHGATNLAVTSVGQGQVANCFRLTIQHDAGTSSVIAKVPSHDAVSRSTAALQHLYEREVSFYQHLAPSIATRTPRCYVAERDDTDNFLLLLEDLSPSAVIDQFVGVSIGTARAGLAALAGLHGPTHANSSLHDATWLRGVSTELRPLYESVLPVLFDQFIERYDARLDEGPRAMVLALKDRLALFSDYVTPFPCVTHGDFRTDNLLIDACDGTVALVVVDWQTVGVGSPLLDVAYFLTTSLSPEDCERYEFELLDYYLAAMHVYDVAIPIDLARHEFARYTLQPVVMLVAASVIVEQTERGDDMFLAMIERAVIAATRWDALNELERRAVS